MEETILKVTQAEPDIKRQVYYEWSSTIYPKWKDSGLFRGAWNGLWQNLKDPEELIDKVTLDFRNLFSKQGLLTDQHPAFVGYTQVLSSLKSFTKLFEEAAFKPSPTPDTKTHISKNIDALKSYYTTFVKNIIAPINQAIIKSSSDFTLKTKDALEEYLAPKAIVKLYIFKK